MEPKIRIISGAPALVELEVNNLLDHYAPTVWNIAPVPDGVCVTCILVHESELRKAQLLGAAMPAVRRP